MICLPSLTKNPGYAYDISALDFYIMLFIKFHVFLRFLMNEITLNMLYFKLVTKLNFYLALALLLNFMNYLVLLSHITIANAADLHPP